MVGSTGKVYAVDLQEGMLQKIREKIKKSSRTSQMSKM
jgi:ubiquinone/menaquinone biosynthesis C-methylase UbiE